MNSTRLMAYRGCATRHGCANGACNAVVQRERIHCNGRGIPLVFGSSTKWEPLLKDNSDGVTMLQNRDCGPRLVELQEGWRAVKSSAVRNLKRTSKPICHAYERRTHWHRTFAGFIRCLWSVARRR